MTLDDLNKAKLVFLNENIFKDLTNINSGFDNESVKYFSHQDFMTVIERCRDLNICIHGIETWLDGEFYDVKTIEDYRMKSCKPKWYYLAMMDFKQEKHSLAYAATYSISNVLLIK